MRAAECRSRLLSVYYHFRPWYHLLVNDCFAKNAGQLAHLGGLLSGLAFWHLPRLGKSASCRAVHTKYHLHNKELARLHASSHNQQLHCCLARAVRAARHHLRRASARSAAAVALPAPLPALAEGNMAIAPSDGGVTTGQQQATLQLLPKEEEKEGQSLWWELAVVCGHLLVGGLVKPGSVCGCQAPGADLRRRRGLPWSGWGLASHACCRWGAGFRNTCEISTVLTSVYRRALPTQHSDVDLLQIATN